MKKITFFRLAPVTPKSRQYFPIRITKKSTTPRTTTTTKRPTTTELVLINRQKIDVPAKTKPDCETSRPEVANKNDVSRVQFGFGERQDSSDDVTKDEGESQEKISEPAFYILIGAGVSIVILFVTGVLILLFLRNHRQKIIGSNTTGSPSRSEQEFELQSSRYDTVNYHGNGTSSSRRQQSVAGEHRPFLSRGSVECRWVPHRFHSESSQRSRDPRSEDMQQNNRPTYHTVRTRPNNYNEEVGNQEIARSTSYRPVVQSMTFDRSENHQRRHNDVTVRPSAAVPHDLSRQSSIRSLQSCSSTNSESFQELSDALGPLRSQE